MALNWLLVFVPITVVLEHAMPERALWIFLASALAIMPLAGWMGKATEQLAKRTGEGIGGLLNATFGNAAELIIALAALRGGLHDVVKASLAGSIVGNILLVLGAAMFAGGLSRSEQHYNASGGRSQATMLTLAVIALIAPAAYRHIAGDAGDPALASLSIWLSLVLLSVYGANLVFSLITHRDLFAGSEQDSGDENHRASWSVGRAVLILGTATACIAWMSEILVGALKPATAALGLNDLFVGVFVVAILGNAAEHSTAIVAAMKNRMDLALSIAIG